MHVVTVSSVGKLVTDVAKRLMSMSQVHARAVRPLHSVSSPVLVAVRVPDLTCTIRRHRDSSFVALVDFQQTLSPDIEDEYRALASHLPAREPPREECYATVAEWSDAYREHDQT